VARRDVFDREMMNRHLLDLQGPVYYIAGPPAMVTAMHGMPLTAGVDEDDVRSEAARDARRRHRFWRRGGVRCGRPANRGPMSVAHSSRSTMPALTVIVHSQKGV
jgi:hypothetical protein